MNQNFAGDMNSEKYQQTFISTNPFTSVEDWQLYSDQRSQFHWIVGIKDSMKYLFLI